jgi:hypothetical protein
MLEIIGGPGRDRTDDLFHAMEARSQTAPQAHVVAGDLTLLFSPLKERSSMQRQTAGAPKTLLRNIASSVWRLSLYPK